MREVSVTDLQTVTAFSNESIDLYFDSEGIDNHFENQSISGIQK